MVLLNLSAEIKENMMCGLRVCQGFSLLLQKGTTKTEYELLFYCIGEEILALGNRIHGAINMVDLLKHGGVLIHL